MRIIAISDTHCTKFPLPDGDILLHMGDMTGLGSLPETQGTLTWLGGYKEKYKSIIVINGNHDQMGEKDPALFRILCNENGITYLQDEEITVLGYRIFGSPWTTQYNNWFFMKTIDEMEEHWKKIPEGIDILMTHEPPHGILDYSTMSHMHIGCRHLLARVWAIRPLVHCFGHNHGQGGLKEENGTKFVNASILDERYIKTKDPIIIDLPDKEVPDVVADFPTP